MIYHFFQIESSKPGILHLKYISFWTRHIPNSQQQQVATILNSAVLEQYGRVIKVGQMQMEMF